MPEAEIGSEPGLRPTRFTFLGVDWDLSLDLFALERVKAECGIDLVSLESQEAVLRLTQDPCGLVAVASQILRDQFHARGVSAETFKAGFRCGEQLELLWTALEGAVLNFFPPRLRSAVTCLYREFGSLVTNALREATAKLANSLPPAETPDSTS